MELVLVCAGSGNATVQSTTSFRGTLNADNGLCLAFAHDDDSIEQEYDRLRDMARAEAEKRNDCFARVRHILSTPIKVFVCTG